MANLIAVEGIGPVYAQKLKEAGISSTEALLAAGATPQGRQDRHWRLTHSSLGQPR